MIHETIILIIIYVHLKWIFNESVEHQKYTLTTLWKSAQKKSKFVCKENQKLIQCFHEPKAVHEEPTIPPVDMTDNSAWPSWSDTITFAFSYWAMPIGSRKRTWRGQSHRFACLKSMAPIVGDAQYIIRSQQSAVCCLEPKRNDTKHLCRENLARGQYNRRIGYE